MARPAPQPPSLQLILVTSTVLLIAGSVALTLIVAVRSGTHGMTAMVQGLQGEIAASLTQQLTTYLETPHRINALNAGSLDAGLIAAEDDISLRRQFFRQAQLFPAATYIQLGRADGSFVGVERGVDGGFTAEVTDRPRTGKAVWTLDDRGDPAGPYTHFIDGYDATTRPWFRAAMAAKQPTWSSIYQFSSRQSVRLGITAVQPWTGPDGQVGVLGTDIVLSHLSHFLDNPRLGEGGRIFIMERDGLLVAATAHAAPFTTEGETAIRLKAHDSPDPLTHAAARALDGMPIRSRVNLQIDTSVGRALVAAQPLTDTHGIDWVVVVVVPEAQYLGPVQQTRRTLLLAGLLTLIFASIGSTLLGRWAMGPLRQLVHSTSAISRLDWDHPIPRGQTRETQQLADAFVGMREQIKEAMVQSEEARRAATDANRAKTAFLQNMSHELRTPLNAIIGYGELLLEDATPDQQDDLNKVLSAAYQLLGLVEEVLDLARVEAGTIEVHPEDVDVAALLRSVHTTALPLATDTGNTLKLELGPGLGTVWADPTKLRQCLLNLVTNSAKFTDEGTVTLGAHREGSWVVFEVIDDGIGIAPEYLESIFTPFLQLDASSTKRHQGVGLGLALTQTFVERMGGSIGVQSTVGSGSVFRIRLPLTPPDPALQGGSHPALDR